MRILHVIASMNPLSGGPCQGIRHFDKKSKILGITREVVSLDEPTSLFLSQDSLQIHALGSGTSPWGYNSKLIPWLTENLHRFDVVIVNGLWLYHSYAAWKALHQLKKNALTKDKTPRFFVMPHGMLDPWFQNEKGRKWKAFRNWVYWKLIERKVVNEADGVLFTCEPELLLARKPFKPYRPKREINIGYGIEEPKAFSASMRTAFLEQCPDVKDKSYLLFLSRIHYKKGIDYLIKAYSNILSTKPELITYLPKLVIAGPGWETAYGQNIKQLINKDFHLKDMVLLVNMLTGDAKWGAIYGCEAFILPSRQENFGIAIIEALACGKPVLISNQVNIWHEIEEANSGIVNEDSVDGTEHSLSQWLNLSSEGKKLMSRQAKNLFTNKYSIDNAISSLSDALGA